MSWIKQRWSAEETELLKELYSDTPMPELVKIFGRKAEKISSKVYALGLKRSDDFMNSGHSGRIMKGQRISAGTEFKKGQISFNKGKRQSEFMSAEGLERVRKTHFKKGHTPVNHKPIGYERVTADGYIEVKVRNGTEKSRKNFELKHRLLWREYFGEIPKGMAVRFKPGADRLHFTIDDLELVNRGDNLMANIMQDKAIVKRFFGISDDAAAERIKNEIPELIELKRSVLKLNQQIKKYE